MVILCTSTGTEVPCQSSLLPTMAEKVPTASDVLEILDEKLKCAVCLQNFTQPKSLPCLHAFCRDCLDHLPRLPQEGGSQVVNCPLCHSPAQLPGDGISGFPDQFRFIDYADARRIVKKIATAENEQPACGLCNKNLSRGFCKQCEHFVCERCIDVHHLMEGHFSGHEIISIDRFLIAASQLKPVKKPSTLQCSRHNKPLDVYCHSPCDKLICHDCTIRVHRDHECDPISEEGVLKRHKQEIDENLLHTKRRLAYVLHKIETFRKQASERSEGSDNVREDTQNSADQMKPPLEHASQREQQDEQVAPNSRFVTAQLEEARKMAAILQTCVDYVEEELNVDSEQYILSGKTLMVNRMKAVTSLVKEEECSHKEEPSVKIVKSTGKLANVGEFEFSLVVDKCMVSGEEIRETRIGRKAKFILATTPTPGSAKLSLPTSFVSFQLYASEATRPIHCQVKETVPGRYEANCSPVTSGLYQLRVRIRNVDIPGSPFRIKVELRVTPLHTIGGLNHPCGVAFGRNGSVVVTESNGFCVTVLDKEEDFGHDVTVLDKEQKRNKSFGSKGTKLEQFKYPRGVTINCDSQIIVSDENNHRIQKFDMEGRSLAVVGNCGSQPLQFRYPDGVAIDRNKKVFVADCGNDRIQVINCDFTFSHAFGFRGMQPGQFKGPCSIAIDSKGMVYITDRGNHRVQKFTPEGVFISQFGKKGRGEGELTFPFGIAIDNTTDTVYVSNNYKVSIFTTNGVFIREFEREGRRDGEFDFSGGLAVDQSTGDLYVCDYYNNRLVVYKPK